MQEKKDTIAHFFQRCAELEDKKGLTTLELCALIGLSRSHYYAIKKGEKPLSARVRRKLDAAERDAMIDHVGADVVTEGDQLTRELVARLDLLTSAITEQNKRIDALLEQRAASARQAEATSSSSRGSSSREKTRTTTPKKLA